MFPSRLSEASQMHGLPKDVDLSFLADAELLQVCFGSNEVILKFDKEISITVESRFRVRIDECEEDYDDASPSAALLVRFLSSSITEVVGQEDGTLHLEFSQGGTIEIYDSSQEYESYQIRHGAKIHVV